VPRRVDQQHARCRVTHEIAQLIGGVGGVEGQKGRTQPNAGGIDSQSVRRFRHLNGNPVARGDTGPLQHRCKPRRTVGEVSVAQRGAVIEQQERCIACKPGLEQCIKLQLSAYHPDKAYGGQRVYTDMLEQARLADRLGFDSVSITEHHLINILMMPAPLVFATKLAAETHRLKILTSVVVLPLHDMRTYAGEVIVTDMLTDGRLMLGVGRGAFGFEMDRLDTPLEISREKFDESLDVLQALLTREEVSWHGKYYNFDPITVMPRPRTPGGPDMMMAVMNPDGIFHCTQRGFHIQTTPLAGNHDLLVEQVDAFNRGKAAREDGGAALTLSLSRVAFLARDAADRQAKVLQAHDYYSRFDNVYTGPGIVDAGMIRSLPRTQSAEELAESLLIEEPAEMVDQLATYAELGIDRVILNMNFGADQAETLDNIHRFAEDVMPYFKPEA